MNKIIYVVLAAVLIFSAVPTVTKAVFNTIGTNISSGGTVYTITSENGQTVRRPYTSAGAFLSYSFNTWANVAPASTEDLQLPVGSFIPPRDGSIICSDRGADKGTCYLITNRMRAGFTSEAVFRQLGFTFQWAKAGDVSFMAADSHVQTGTEVHRVGTLINIDGTVYYISTQGLKGFESMESLRSWGYWQSDIITANAGDRMLSRTGVLYARPLSDISPMFGPVATPSTGTLDITDTPMPQGVVGFAYAHQFNATGGTAPYTWEHSSAPGSNQNVYQCCIIGLQSSGDFTSSGNPLPNPGNYQIVVKVTDATGATKEKTFNYSVISAISTSGLNFSLTSPRAGTEITKGSYYSINWEMSNASSTIPTEIYLYDGEGWVYAGAPISTVDSRNGMNTYSWYVPYTLGPSSNFTPEYQIVITPRTSLNCDPDYTICIDEDLARFSGEFEVVE